MNNTVPFIKPVALSPLERFGPVLLTLVPAVSLLLLITRPVWDVDIFWQLKLGELILARGDLVHTEPFAAAHVGEPIPSLSWAAQALYAALRMAGGWSLLRTFDALCWLGGFWAAAWSAYRRGAPAFSLAFSLALSLMVTLPYASLRPQSLGALCFGLLIALTYNPLCTSLKLLLGALLFVAWQNLHPSVAIAVVWLGALAGYRLFKVLCRRTASVPWESIALAILATIAVFATPEGLGILDVSTANAALSHLVGVSEWMPLWASINRGTAISVAIAALLAGAMLCRSSQIDANELVPMLVLLALAVITSRFVLFWAIALVPIVARSTPTLAVHSLPRWWVAPTLLATLAGVILPTRFSPQLPLQAVEALRTSGIVGTVYSHFPWGGPLIDAGYPAWQVAYDGRYYRYTQSEWEAYFAASRGEVSLSAIEARWHPSAFLLDPVWNAPLIAALRSDRHWHELSGTGRAIAFIPSRSQSAPH